ncbi:hypothetical protein J3R30DRAFT_1348578 [Lentinula aciculospora]|uniref:Survival Motor Neuron Gemin2-binding domain-containing protein n=1 Tax=Lentinula aciculospora TaxID=153920 RepID=A0A9W9AN27_9AGAR|nr:hypothetical protein J3R30DRAFT_1348578 [Lentinula aciculospora]
MRPVVSYDDITLPYGSLSGVVHEASKDTAHENSDCNSRTATTKSSSSKKRKRKSRHSAAASGKYKTPGYSSVNGEEDDEDADYLEVEENRELTHDEIWDDSALIEAWNAAAEEYKAYHGPDKGWKNEPVHKSPLWYNTPPPPSKKRKASHALPTSVLVGTTVTASVEDHTLNNSIAAGTGLETDTAMESDSKPIDFGTFVPTYDAGLSSPGPALRKAAEGVPKPDFLSQYATTVPNPGQMVSQDEAFKRALEATYWSGYWTAVYHSQNQNKGTESSLVEATSKNITTEAVSEGEREDEDNEIIDSDVQAILDIGNDGQFEGDVDLIDGEGEGESVGDVNEAGEDEENDSLASSSRGDFVSTQR